MWYKVIPYVIWAQYVININDNNVIVLMFSEVFSNCYYLLKLKKFQMYGCSAVWLSYFAPFWN